MVTLKSERNQFQYQYVDENEQQCLTNCAKTHLTLTGLTGWNMFNSQVKMIFFKRGSSYRRGA
jgi:hypothetical protein